jgi:hypothetical protein
VDAPRYHTQRILYVAGFAGLLAVTFANYALQELGHDEGMYLGASYLAMSYELYTELGYFQAPNLPLLLSTFFAWSDVSHLLMWGRVVTFAHGVITLVLLGAISWHLTRNSNVTFAFVTWLGLNGFLYSAGYSIDNTTFASMYLLAGYYAVLRAHESEWKNPALVAASGFFVALAPGFKLNYLPFSVCFAAAVGLFSARRTLATFLMGALVGFAPLLYMAIARGPAFWFNNVVWHRRLLAVNVEELGVRGMAAGFATDAWFYLTRPTWMMIPVVLVGIAVVLFLGERKRFGSFERALLSWMLASSLVTIGALGAVRFWYLQPTVIVGALLVPSVYPELRPKRQTLVRVALVLAALIGILMQAPSLASSARVFDPSQWTPLRYSATGADVARLSSRRHAQSVATIGNPAIVYGAEGALPLAPSAATGAFIRVSSPIRSRRSPLDTTIATYDGLSSLELDMIIATVDYVSPHVEVAPDDWCRPEKPQGQFDELFDRLCASGFKSRVIGEGPARAVVFYRDGAGSDVGPFVP